MFPFNIRTTMVFDNADADAVEAFLFGVDAEIRRLKGKHIERVDDTVSFCGGLFRLVNSYNLLGAITSGTVRAAIEEGQLKVHYELRFTQLLIMMMVQALFFGAIIAAVHESLTAGIMMAFVLLLFGGGMNVLIGSARFGGLLRKIAARVATPRRTELWPIICVLVVTCLLFLVLPGGIAVASWQWNWHCGWLTSPSLLGPLLAVGVLATIVLMVLGIVVVLELGLDRLLGKTNRSSRQDMK